MLACPTFGKRPIESQWIFSGLSHHVDCASIVYELASGFQGISRHGLTGCWPAPDAHDPEPTWPTKPLTLGLNFRRIR
jgi:hypothetical protein